MSKVREAADLLTTSIDMIGDTHRLAGQKLADCPRNSIPIARELLGQGYALQIDA